MTLKILEGKGRKICVINKVLGDFFWKTGMNAMDEAGVPRLGSIVLRRLMTTPSGQLCFKGKFLLAPPLAGDRMAGRCTKEAQVIIRN